MRNWTSILGAVLIILMMWSGTTAQAAERFDCIPVSVEMAGHFDGDRDEAPSGQDQGVAHHHSGCSGHHIASPANSDPIELSFTAFTTPAMRQEAGVPGHGPGALLRPPIA